MLNVADLGFGIKSVLIEDNYDGVAGFHKHYVTIIRGDKDFSIEYTSGCGNRHHPKTGLEPIALISGRLTVSQRDSNLETIPNDPTLEDVMYGLMSDSDCVRFGQSFEDFCGDLGYDEDSRKAEGVYKACIKQWKNLERLGYDMDKLSDLFQDY